MKKLIYKSVLAGLLIGLAACIFVSCENKIIGACLFSIGLIAVILLEAYLFTGKVGYINSKDTLKLALIGLIFNLVTAFCVGLIFKLCNGTQTVFNSRLDKSWYKLLFDGFGCGVLIYLAVELYKKSNNIITIILPVIAFILAGMEHCIADIAYFGMGELTWQGLLDILIIIIGNSIGSMLIRSIQTEFFIKRAKN